MITFTTSTKQGSRLYQEDRFVCEVVPEGHLLAVFDGHGGSEVSDTCADNMMNVWDSLGPVAIGRLETEAKLTAAIRVLVSMTRKYICGSTASIAILSNPFVSYAILGDSPVIIRDANHDLFRSPEHNIRTNELEAERAISRGGVLYNGYLFDSMSNDGLQMSRALGDLPLDKVLSRKPYVNTVEIGANSWILVGSDGIVDPSHKSPESEIGPIISGIELQGWTARDIVNRAIELPTNDNATAVLAKVE